MQLDGNLIVGVGNCSACILQALKMSYFSNKPAPTPGSMLPQPVLPSAVVNEPSDKRSLKRKQSASAESGLYLASLYKLL